MEEKKMVMGPTCVESQFNDDETGHGKDSTGAGERGVNTGENRRLMKPDF